MTGSTQSKTVFVTGASRGLGAALALEFRKRGWRVLAGVRTLSASPVADGIQEIQLDVGDEHSLQRLRERCDGFPIDILINNAAIRGDAGGLDTLTVDDFLEVMKINALAPLLVTRSLLPNLRQGSSKIIANISSRAGSMVEGTIDDDDGDYAYRCSKAALNMATTKLAADLKPGGIAVLSLHPGWVKTDMGGAEADVPVSAAARGLADMILRSGLDDTASFRSYDTTPIAW